jgi:hypothetical protein
MNVTDITRKVLRLFGDSADAIVIQQTDIYDWINEAQLVICRQTGCLTGTLTSALSSYPKALPADWISTKRVGYGTNPTVNLKFIEIDDLDNLNVDPTQVVDTPLYYYHFAGQLRLYPMTTTSGQNIIHDYTKLPTTVAGLGTALDVPVSFHEDIVRFCVMRAHERNENWNAFRESKVIMQESSGLRQDEANISDDEFFVVRDDPGEW